MRRLALLLAASVLGTGCIVSSDSLGSGDVNVYWYFAKHAPAQLADGPHSSPGFLYYDESLEGVLGSGTCDEAAVDTIRVIPPGGAAIDVDCAIDSPLDGVAIQGIQVLDVPEGTRTFRISGYRDGVLVYDDALSVVVAPGRTTDLFADVRGVGAPLDLFGDLAFGAGPTFYLDCAEAIAQGSTALPQIGYQIRDVVFGLPVEAGRVVCQDPLPSPVYADTLDLDDYDVRMIGYDGSTASVTFDSCTVPIAHFGTQIGQNGLALTLLTNPIPVCN